MTLVPLHPVWAHASGCSGGRRQHPGSFGPDARQAGVCDLLLRPLPAAAQLAAPPPPCPPQAWGAWWALTLYARYVRCLASKRPFRARGWARLPVGPACLRAAPLEAIVKVVLPLVGVLGGEWKDACEAGVGLAIGFAALASRCRFNWRNAT